jgi:hypothetical protein
MFSEAVKQFDESWVAAIARKAAATGQPQYEVARDLVQALPWSPQISAAFLPDEVIWKGTGDCDDAAILLAALLRKLGYRTMLWLITEDNHMALGVAIPDLPYPVGPASYTVIAGTRYYFLEATKASPIGVVPDFPHWYSDGVAIFPEGEEP